MRGATVSSPAGVPRRLLAWVVVGSLLIGSAPALAQISVVPGRGRAQQTVELTATFNVFAANASGTTQKITLYTVPANERLVITDIWVSGTSAGRVSILRNADFAAGNIPTDAFYAVQMLTGIEFQAGQQVVGSFFFPGFGTATPQIHLRGYLTSP